MAKNNGCSCSIGCITLVFIFLFFVWFLFMGGCTLIYKKTQEAIQDTKIESSSGVIPR